jgi:hypothetical protein
MEGAAMMKNAEGYHDPTAGIAVSRVTKEEDKETWKRIREMMQHFDYVAGINGFRIENRIIFRDLSTGKEFR